MGSKPDKYYIKKVLFEIKEIIQYTNGLLFDIGLSSKKNLLDIMRAPI